MGEEEEIRAFINHCVEESFKDVWDEENGEFEWVKEYEDEETIDKSKE